MDLTVFPRDFNLFSSLFLVLTPLFIVLIFLKQTKSVLFKKGQNLPPGPHPWPIIGNILHMGSKPHISLAQLAQVHGPLISLRLGTRLLVVGSTPAAATEILKTHDRLLSGRYLPKAALADLQRYSLVFAPECSEHWKSLRAFCRNDLFSAKAIDSQSVLREKKVAEMVNFLRAKEGEVVKIGEIAFATLFNILGNTCFSMDLIGLNDDDDNEGVGNGFKGKIWEMMELGATPNISDFYPVFDRLDPQGLKKRFMKVVKEVFGVWEIIIKERRESQKGLRPPNEHDFLDAMLASGFSDIQIQVLALELFSAGTETTSSTIEWAMSELVKNKEAMYKIGEELRREISSTSTSSIKESHISQLPYLHACVKETLRLHPPVPFLIPHYALETCEVMSYIVPKNSQVIVNLWAVGRDPMSWEDPLSFKPERFLDSHLDFKGQDFEFLPFGAGRRMCPGLPLATKQVHFILAALIHNFDWFLPDNEDPSQLDMGERFGITLQKEQPLLIIPKKKL